MKQLDLKHTGLVITDPQNDFLSEEGAAWKMVGDSVEENNTIEHLEQLLEAVKNQDIPVFISPHYYYPTDRRPNGPTHRPRV